MALLRQRPLKGTEPIGGRGTPAGLGKEAGEVLAEVSHEEQGLRPEVDLCFLEQIVISHLHG